MNEHSADERAREWLVEEMSAMAARQRGLGRVSEAEIKGLEEFIAEFAAGVSDNVDVFRIDKDTWKLAVASAKDAKEGYAAVQDALRPEMSRRQTHRLLSDALQALRDFDFSWNLLADFPNDADDDGLPA